jgi:exopolysaccharide biosynthesis predicted pyruvyltransferase EpsI
MVSASQQKVFLVDVPNFLHRIVPDELMHDAVTVSHDVQDIYGETIKFDIARHLLSLYRDQARLVITTRLHCTLPCLAMGIPVIFFADTREARVTVAQQVGLKTYPLDARREDVDWNPAIHDIEAEKQSIVAALREKWNATLSSL